MRYWMVAMAAAVQPGAALAQDAAAGRILAQTWCANCHAVDARPAIAADQVPGFTAIANRPGVTADGLRAFLSAPHGRMPDLSLSRTDIDNAIAYLLTLRAK